MSGDEPLPAPGDVCGIRFGNNRVGVTEDFTVSDLYPNTEWVELVLRRAGLQPDGTRQPPRVVRVCLDQLTLGRLSLNVWDGAGAVLRPSGRTTVLTIEDGTSPVRGNG